MGSEPDGSSLFQEGGNPEKVQHWTGLGWNLDPVDVNRHDHLLQQKRTSFIIYSQYLAQTVFLVDFKVTAHVDASSFKDHAENLTKIKAKCTSGVKSNMHTSFDTNFQKLRLRFVWSNGSNWNLSMNYGLPCPEGDLSFHHHLRWWDYTYPYCYPYHYSYPSHMLKCSHTCDFFF